MPPQLSQGPPLLAHTVLRPLGSGSTVGRSLLRPLRVAPPQVDGKRAGVARWCAWSLAGGRPQVAVHAWGCGRTHKTHAPLHMLAGAPEWRAAELTAGVVIEGICRDVGSVGGGRTCEHGPQDCPGVPSPPSMPLRMLRMHAPPCRQPLSEGHPGPHLVSSDDAAYPDPLTLLALAGPRPWRCSWPRGCACIVTIGASGGKHTNHQGAHSSWC